MRFALFARYMKYIQHIHNTRHTNNTSCASSGAKFVSWTGGCFFLPSFMNVITDMVFVNNFVSSTYYYYTIHIWFCVYVSSCCNEHSYGLAGMFLLLLFYVKCITLVVCKGLSSVFLPSVQFTHWYYQGIFIFRR